MRSSLLTPPTPVDSIVIDELPPQKPTTTLLHNYHGHSNHHHHHHLYNYWTLNERLRSKNEQLSKRQQSSCRIAFYSLWLCISACVFCIIIYRFTDECTITSTIQQQNLLIAKCLRHGLFLMAICIGILSCSGVMFGACRYFRSQPETLPFDDEHELHLTQNYDLLPGTSTHSCCCQSSSTSGGAGILPSHQIQNHDDEHSNVSLTSWLTNTTPRRKMPPFTYEELPPAQPAPLRPLLPLPHINSPQSTQVRNSTIPFLSSSTSSSSSPHSILSTTTTSNNIHGSRHNNNGKATVVFEDASASTPNSYTTCVCGTDVWERQQRPSISGLSRKAFASL